MFTKREIFSGIFLDECFSVNLKCQKVNIITPFFHREPWVTCCCFAFGGCPVTSSNNKSSFYIELITDRIRSMGEVDVFTHVCHSVQRGSAFGGRGSVFGGALPLEEGLPL